LETSAYNSEELFVCRTRMVTLLSTAAIAFFNTLLIRERTKMHVIRMNRIIKVKTS
jgi:hypothetical protein